MTVRNSKPRVFTLKLDSDVIKTRWHDMSTLIHIKI